MILIKKWQNEGAIINRKPEVIAAILQAMYHPILHKDDFERDDFADIIELLVDIMAAGLVVEN